MSLTPSLSFFGTSVSLGLGWSPTGVQLKSRRRCGHSLQEVKIIRHNQPTPQAVCPSAFPCPVVQIQCSLRAVSERDKGLRIGYGEDTHRLAEGHELWLGGVRVESERGAIAHSDGDVVLHALADALLSAFALGDIGALFPDHDPKWKGLESQVILEVVLQKVRENGYRLGQVAAVVMLDKPKLGPHRQTIQHNLAQMTGLPEDRVGLTFKTSEGMATEYAQCRAMVYLEAED